MDSFMCVSVLECAKWGTKNKGKKDSKNEREKRTSLIRMSIFVRAFSLCLCCRWLCMVVAAVAVIVAAKIGCATLIVSFRQPNHSVVNRMSYLNKFSIRKQNQTQQDPLKMHKNPVNQSRFTERQKQQIWKYTEKMDVEAQSMKSNSAIFKVASYAINSVICTLMKNAAFLHRKKIVDEIQSEEIIFAQNGNKPHAIPMVPSLFEYLK